MGQCWDLGSFEAGAEVVMTPCHYEDTYSSQKWYRTTNSNVEFNIQSYSYGMCLDLRSNDVGAHVITAPCHYEDTYLSQKWYWSGRDTVNFRNGNGLCMDRPTANGGPVVMTKCHYEDSFLSQKWAVVGYW
ncbi:RICIN domain-containing protein [Streptomyces graminifolii]